SCERLYEQVAMREVQGGGAANVEVEQVLDMRDIVQRTMICELPFVVQRRPAFASNQIVHAAMSLEAMKEIPGTIARSITIQFECVIPGRKDAGREVQSNLVAELP